MRLALITHRFVRGDGQGRVNYELARAALTEGHIVFLLATEAAPELTGHPLARFVRIGVTPFPTALVQNQVFALRTALWLWRHRRELDLVQSNGFVSWSRCDVSTAHFVHAAWIRSRFHTWRMRKDVYGLYQWLYGFTGQWLERWSYRRAGCIVAVSEQVRSELIESGVDPARVRVIPNGVDTEEFRPVDAKRPIPGLPQGKLVLFIGDIKTPRKNLDTLLRAMVQVADATLVVAGDIAGSPYPRMATKLGLDSRVCFLGFRRNIPELMRAASLFVFPSRYEACSLVLLEAAASGVPIVACRTTGGTELLTPECSVLLEDPNDHVALAAALNRLLTSAAQLARMGEEARRVALRNTWQRMAERYLQLYREVAERRNSENADDVHPREAGT